MNSQTQYRTIVGDAVGQPDAQYPGERWEKIINVAQERGMPARLESRSIHSADFLELLADRTGWMKLGNVVVGPWQVIAQA